MSNVPAASPALKPACPRLPTKLCTQFVVGHGYKSCKPCHCILHRKYSASILQPIIETDEPLILSPKPLTKAITQPYKEVSCERNGRKKKEKKRLSRIFFSYSITHTIFYRSLHLSISLNYLRASVFLNIFIYIYIYISRVKVNLNLILKYICSKYKLISMRNPKCCFFYTKEQSIKTLNNAKI